MKKASDNHQTIAKQAISKALNGEHDKALKLYQQALRQGRDQNASMIEMRYYSECALDSMELSGHFDGVINYCTEALNHYDVQAPQTDVAFKDKIHLIQRREIARIKKGESESIDINIKQALAQAKEKGLALPLLEKVKNWMDQGFHIDTKRIEQEQYRHKYFIVDKQNPVFQNDRAYQS